MKSDEYIGLGGIAPANRINSNKIVNRYTDKGINNTVKDYYYRLM